MPVTRLKLTDRGKCGCRNNDAGKQLLKIRKDLQQWMEFRQGDQL